MQQSHPNLQILSECHENKFIRIIRIYYSDFSYHSDTNSDYSDYIYGFYLRDYTNNYRLYFSDKI